MNFKTFICPGCIEVCNGDAKYVNGNMPEIARIFHDRHIEWRRKRITQEMRDYVEGIASEPFVAISASQQVNFYES